MVFKAIQADFWICSSLITIPQSYLGKKKRGEKKKKAMHTQAQEEQKSQDTGKYQRKRCSICKFPSSRVAGLLWSAQQRIWWYHSSGHTSFSRSVVKPSFKTPTQHVPCQYHHSKPCSCVWVNLGLKFHREHLGCMTETLRQLVCICLRQCFEFVQYSLFL